MKDIIDKTFTSVYSDRNYVESYTKYRWMPITAFSQYFNATERYFKQNCSILDIGAGTGQFSVRLASFLTERGINYSIDALDPSFQALQILKRIVNEKQLTSINTIYSPFEEYEFDGLYDVIICSEMIHLVKDMKVFANRVCKILKKDGVVLVRTPSPNQIWSRSSYDFFPTCRYVDLLRNKSMELIDSVFSLYDKRIKKVKRIDESQYIEKDFYVGMFREKAYSTLHAIDESEFQDGLKRLSIAYKDEDYVYWDFKMSLYVVI